MHQNTFVIRRKAGKKESAHSSESDFLFTDSTGNLSCSRNKKQIRPDLHSMEHNQSPNSANMFYLFGRGHRRRFAFLLLALRMPAKLVICYHSVEDVFLILTAGLNKRTPNNE